MTKYHVYKAPKKDGDIPVETYSYDPVYHIQSLAMKYGPIQIVSEEILPKEEKVVPNPFAEHL